MILSAKIFLAAGTFSALLAVVLGAFSAHALKSRLTDSLYSAFQTAVEYQFYHAFALMFTGILIAKFASSLWLNLAGGLFVAGILFFSGSLYFLALGGPRWLGPITPIGGLCFIVAWCLLLIAIVKM